MSHGGGVPRYKRALVRAVAISMDDFTSRELWLACRERARCSGFGHQAWINSVSMSLVSDVLRELQRDGLVRKVRIVRGNKCLYWWDERSIHTCIEYLLARAYTCEAEDTTSVLRFQSMNRTWKNPGYE